MKSMKLLSVGLVSLCALALGAPSVFAADPVANTTGDVKFIEDTGTVEPGKPEVVDPSNPGEVPGIVDPKNPEEEGSGGNGTKAFNINWMSKFKFGEIKIAGTTMSAFAQPTTLNWAEDNGTGTLVPTDEKSVGLANFLQVTDNRGANTGWKVSVNAGAFYELDNASQPILNSELEGASLTLNEPQVIGAPDNTATAPVAFASKTGKDLIGAGEVTVLNAINQTGQGTWSLTWGAKTDEAILKGITVVPGTPDTTTGAATAGVKLSVPVSAQPKVGKSYQSKLVWTLGTTPEA